jgi:hypothetical protein
MASRKSILRSKRYAEDPEYRERKLAIQRTYEAAHEDEINARRLARRYGISGADYDRLLARQGGVCAICRRRSDRRLGVDHCHSTRKVRGLLCVNCNTALGLCHDDPDRMRAAIAYLEASRRDVDELVNRSMGRAGQGARCSEATNGGHARREPPAGSPQAVGGSRRESAEPISGCTSGALTHPTVDAATPPAAPRRCRAAGSAGPHRRIR